MDEPKKQIYYFDDIEIDIPRSCVRRGAPGTIGRGECRLRQKTFQVLLYLIEHRGAEVSKSDLIRDVWRDTAVVDDVLVQSVKDIRRALGDDRRDPRFIRTIPKFGYSFIAEISARPPAAPPRISQDRQTAFSAFGAMLRHRIVFVSIFALVFVFLIAVTIGQDTWAAKEQAASAATNDQTENLEAYRYYSLGVEKAAALQNNEAIEWFEKAIALDPQFAMAQARIGYTYAVKWNFPEKGKPYLERAFQLSDRLSEKDRLNIAAWYSIANLDFEMAIEQYRQIVAKYPLEIEAYERLARLLRGEGRTDEAVAVLKKGLEIDPAAKNLYNQLGSTLSTLSRHEEAIAAHRRYIELSPNEPNAYDSLGLTYQWMGDYPSAIENYNRALEFDPKFDVALVHLANARFQTGKYREAVRLYQLFIENAQSDIERERGLASIAMVYVQKRDLRSAEKAARELLNVRSDLPALFLSAQTKTGPDAFRVLGEKIRPVPVRLNRGSRLTERFSSYAQGFAALRSGRADEAIADLQAALKNDAPVWDADTFEDCLGRAYLELGRAHEAAAEFERILQLNPNYPLASFYLAQAYEKLGAGDKARMSYSRFLETWKNADPDIPEIIAARNALSKN